MKNRLFIAICVAVAMASCSTPRNFNYLQDLKNGEQITTPTDGTIRLKVNDQITMLVRSKDPELGNLFNKGIITNLKAGLADQSLYMIGYTVGTDGSIDIPSAGKINIEGMTRFEAQETIQKKLRDEKLLKDANVTIELANLTYTVMGEVNKPGNYAIEKDAVTLFEALGKAGDISIYGKRDSVMLIRQNGKHKKIYNLCLNNGKEIFNSDAYYVQQNDVIYVKANESRARQSQTPGNESRTLSFWLTLTSVLTAVAVFLFK
jgi:polysaccharide export outer membrane protein